MAVLAARLSIVGWQLSSCSRLYASCGCLQIRQSSHGLNRRWTACRSWPETFQLKTRWVGGVGRDGRVVCVKSDSYTTSGLACNLIHRRFHTVELTVLPLLRQPFPCSNRPLWLYSVIMRHLDPAMPYCLHPVQALTDNMRRQKQHTESMMGLMEVSHTSPVGSLRQQYTAHNGYACGARPGGFTPPHLSCGHGGHI
jgi:hypothetical protein